MSSHTKRLCVFCGSSPGAAPEYMAAATSLGHMLVERGVGLVYGGASVGLMGAVADAVLERGGEVIGVIPRKLVAMEVAHKGLADLKIVDSMHERKAFMEKSSDAFIALPGGFGTLDELCEIITWAQLGYHKKPCGILNINGYFDGFMQFIDHAVEQKFIDARRWKAVVKDDDPQRLLGVLLNYN